MRLLIKYASRGRPKPFLLALQNIKDSIGPANCEIIVSADMGDPYMDNNGLRNEIKKYSNVKIFYGDHTTKVDAINRDLEHAKEWDFLINMSDDMRFVVNGWYKLIVDDIKNIFGDSLDFFAHFNDGHVAHRLATMSIIGKKYYNRDGYIYHPSYKSVSCDAEAYYVALMRGRHHYFPKIYFIHEHPANTRKKPDHLYVYNNRFDNQDTMNYFDRMGRLFEVENPVMIPDEVRKRAKKAI